MRTREHVWANDRCEICGAAAWPKLRAEVIAAGHPDPGEVDQRTCHEREIMPKPERRVYAVEDVDTISTRLEELRRERDACGASNG